MIVAKGLEYDFFGKDLQRPSEAYWSMSLI